MKKMPVLFVGHGSPMNAEARRDKSDDFLRKMKRSFIS